MLSVLNDFMKDRSITQCPWI